MFYINPFFVRGNPSFYDGAIKNKLSKQAEKLFSHNHEISFIANEFNQKIIEEKIPFSKVYTITQKEIINKQLNSNDVESFLYQGDANYTEMVTSLISENCPKNIDIIITWETPAKFLEKIYPNIPIIHQMPGYLSRMPFPELLTFDSQGLFDESRINNLKINNNINKDAIELLKFIRFDTLPFIDEKNPYPRALLDPEDKFEKLILLPLQITEQYAFLCESPYKSQLSLMIDVLEKTPKNIGVVVTQYNTGNSNEEVINQDNIHLFQDIYPNLIWHKSFSELDHSSQYILSSVDAVATISSSIGMQCLLWGKPLISLCNNHLSNYSSFKGIDDYAINHNSIKTKNNDEILAWTLSNTQPLASLINNDDNFLNELINKLRTKNFNFSFYDIEPNYNTKFIESVRKSRSEALLNSKFNSKFNNKLSESFESEIIKNEPKLISFDIFDTLIDRSIEQPHHIFRLIENDVNVLTNGQISNFSSIRQASERHLRSSLTNGVQEITIDEIYVEISKRTDIRKEIADKIKALEIKEELNNIKCRASGKKLFDIAMKSNAKIILISDMYLDKETIKKILFKCGYPEITLYLSSEYRVRKHEGDLFDLVSLKEKINHNFWIHVGDNQHGDIKVANNKKIKTFHLKSAFKNIESNSKLFNLMKNDRKSRSPAEAAIYGLIQRKYFDNQFMTFAGNTYTGGDAYKLGYIAVAPMMFGFLQWIMTQAKNDGVEKLLFLSRDGKVLYRMAGILFPPEKGWPEIDYALSSRRSARVASIFCKGDISALIDSAISNSKISDFFSGKFGLDIRKVSLEILNKHGFKDYESRIDSKDRESLRELSNQISEVILQSAKKEREHLSKYYYNLGVNEHTSVGLVDIGYAGTMQAALERITSAKCIKGYYYITFDTALNQLIHTGPMRGYAGEFVKRTISSDPICNNGFLYETIFCSSDKSFVCFKEDSHGNSIAKFLSNEGDYKRREIVDKIHNACICFAKDMYASYSHYIDLFNINSISASKIFNDFIKTPGGRDAEIFEGCIFEDAFSGSNIRYIVPPREITKKNKLNDKDFIWKEGTAVFLRRPDIFDTTNCMNKKSTNISPSLNDNKIDLIKRNINKEIKKINKTKPPLLERIFINSLLTTSKKNKYFKNRELFFNDSKKKLANLYWNLINITKP